MTSSGHAHLLFTMENMLAKFEMNRHSSSRVIAFNTRLAALYRIFLLKMHCGQWGHLRAKIVAIGEFWEMVLIRP